MSSKPSYDPNSRQIKYFFNDAIANAFEPGSTMKIFTLAAAINEGVYKGQDYYQSGTYPVGNRKIKDHNGGAGWGSITFDEGVEIFQRSVCNFRGSKTWSRPFPKVYSRFRIR